MIDIDDARDVMVSEGVPLANALITIGVGTAFSGRLFEARLTTTLCLRPDDGVNGVGGPAAAVVDQRLAVDRVPLALPFHGALCAEQLGVTDQPQPQLGRRLKSAVSVLGGADRLHDGAGHDTHRAGAGEGVAV